MRRYLAIIAVLSAVLLTGLGHRPPKPSPTPSPTPTATPTPALPTVMIYPFTVNGDADKRAGAKLAALYTSEIRTMGGIIIKPVPTPAVDRKMYLTAAIQNGADYYFSGYITPVGEEVALVQQLVSTTSGAIIWSATAQISTYGDAIDQADTVRKVLLGHAGRVEAQYQAQQSAATAPPVSNGAQTNIGTILGIFHRMKPGPKPTLAPDKKPKRGILVVQVAANPSSLNNPATVALALSLDRAYLVGRSAVVTQNISSDSRIICGALTNETIASGEFRTEATSKLYRNTSNVFTLRIYRCDGSVMFSNTGRSGSMGGAIDNAVNAYMKDHPNND